MKIIYDEGIASLGDSYHGWVNDPSSAVNLQLNELIEHIAANIVIFKLKYHNESELTDQIETFLDDTFTLFSSYGINNYDIQHWRRSRRRLFGTFSETELCTTRKSSNTPVQLTVQKGKNEKDRLFNALEEVPNAGNPRACD